MIARRHPGGEFDHAEHDAAAEGGPDLAAGRVVREQLYGIGPSDWPTILGVASFMTLVTVVAAVAPALSATRIDPVVVLRHDAAS